MTQEEVNLIYDYLHENFKYKDGDLIHKYDTKNKSKKQGERLGSFFPHTIADPYLVSSVTINNKRYRMKLIKFIFIYHNKYLPLRVYQIDHNPMNTKIENLEESSQSIIQHKKALDRINKFPMVKNKDGTHGYTVRTKLNGKDIKLGTYRTKSLALEIYQLSKKLILDDKLKEDEVRNIISKKYPESSLNILSNTGFKGVSRRSNKFCSQIRINGIKTY